MIELHGQRVLEQVQIPGLHGAEAVRDEPAVHQRPGVVGGAGLQAGDEGTEQDLHEHEQHDRRCPADIRADRAAAGRPSRSSIDSATQTSAPKIAIASPRCRASRYWLTSMRSARPERTMYQPIKPCSAAQREDAGQPAQQRARHLSGGQEPEERHEEDDADQAAEEAMRPFPPEDGLERVEAHAPVDVVVLRDLLVLGERLQPVGLRQRRHGARRSAAIR